MKLTYLFPSRSRPEKLLSALKNIYDMSLTGNFSVMVCLDFDDETIKIPGVLGRLNKFERLKIFYGFSKSKIEAINRDLIFIPDDTDILILMSDDMEFKIKGFDEMIRHDMQKHFSDLDGILHYPDGSQVQDRIITMPIMGINFFKRFGYIYNPEYTSLWADLEQTNVAKNLGKYHYCKEAEILSHNHPVWTRQPYDELMKRNESFYNSDKEIYFKRLANNFDL